MLSLVRIRIVGGLTASLVIAFHLPAQAQRQVFDRLTNVGVHVVGVPPVAKQLGVDSVALRQNLERRLQDAGFGVLTGARLAEFQETPRVVVTVSALTVDSAYFFSITMELLERVALKRSGAETYGYNWSRQALGAATLEEALKATNGAVDRLTTDFLEARRRSMSVALGTR
jgi:hypothetical protein